MPDQRMFHAPNANLNQVSQALADWFRSQRFEIQTLEAPGGGLMLQARQQEVWRSVLGMSATLNIQMRKQSDGNLVVEMGAGKWYDKAAAAGVGMFLLWPMLFTAGYGAWQQSQLPQRTFEFLQNYLATSSYGNAYGGGGNNGDNAYGGNNYGGGNYGNGNYGNNNGGYGNNNYGSGNHNNAPTGDPQGGVKPPEFDSVASGGGWATSGNSSSSESSEPASMSAGASPGPGGSSSSTASAGTAGTARFCGNCGAKLPDGAKFCANCGTKAV